MRPIKVTMTAFGPYSKKQVIDFTELNSRNLFLVTGPTGAGKTTIFDAISYALYGRTSGGHRSEDTLRSHFAAEDLLTEVALTFELKGVVYHIHRIPGQLRPKSRGEGFTEQKPEAELVVEDGDPRTVYTGVSKVNNKIEGLLGINVEQFRQIMMIPQGDFRKLLTADSQEREKVLQQLFDTYLYKRIQNELNEQAKKLGSDIKGQRVERDTLIGAIKTVEASPLYALIHAEDKPVDRILDMTSESVSEDKKLLKVKQKEIATLDKEIQAIVEAKTKAEAMNKNLEAKVAKEENLNKLRKEQPEIDRKREKLALAEKAALLSGSYDALQERGKQLQARNQEKGQNHNELIEAQDQAEKLKAGLDLLENEASVGHRRQLGQTLERLKGYEGKVKELTVLEKDLGAATKTLEEVQGLIKTNEERITKGKEVLAEVEQRLETLKDTSLKLHKGASEKVKIEEQIEGISKGKTLIESYEKDTKSLYNHSAAIKTLEEKRDLSTKKFKEGKLIFLTNQAALLAKDLSQGNPCPVCGSTDHPMPAHASDAMISQEALDQLEKVAVDDDRRLNLHKQQEAVLLERCNNSKDALFGHVSHLLTMEVSTLEKASIEGIIDRLNQTEEQVIKSLKIIQEQVEQLEKDQKEEENLLVNQKKYAKKLEELGKESDKALAEKTIALSDMTAMKTSIERVCKDVPENLRDYEVLISKTEEVQLQLNSAEEALKSARDRFRISNDRYVAAAAKQKQLLKAIEEDEKAYEMLKGRFILALEEAGFRDELSYRDAVLSADAMAALKKEIDLFNKKLEGLIQLIEELRKGTEGAKIVDLTAFGEDKAVREGSRKALVEEEGFLKSKMADNLSTIKKVEAINVKIKDKEDAYTVVGQLARIAQGNNPKMMTFERYVLAAFLEDIIIAANSRLRQMTQGRYELSRSSELQRKNRQSGLELEVFDNFTGRSRHVKTLSGGESFKASLSMALGLSDVVQSYAGGVRLDTMFIDEGFGTLDQESLDSAINCLIDLQKSGRLVGIISHVQELKERIDTRLEITASNVGSQAKFVVG